MAPKREDRYIRFYTEGTAAYKIEKAEAEQPQPKTSLPKPRKRTVYVFPVDLAAIGTVVLCVVMLVLMLNAVGQLDAERAKLQTMTDYLYDLQSSNTLLEAEYESQIDLQAVQERALALGMIPIEQAQHITIQVEPEVEEAVQQELTIWQKISTYLEGLFA